MPTPVCQRLPAVLSLGLLLGCKSEDLPVEQVVFRGDPVVSITAGTPTVAADGRSVVDLTLTATGPDGSAVPDGLLLDLAASRGRVSGVTPTEDGVAHASFVAGTYPAPVVLSVPGFLVDADPLELVPPPPCAVQLHVHGSFSEGSAAMLDHLNAAEVAGLDLVWWTDHDGGYPVEGCNLGSINFEAGALRVPYMSCMSSKPRWLSLDERHNTLADGGAEVSEVAAHTGEYGWRLYGEGSSDSASGMLWQLEESAAAARALITEVDLSFWIRRVSVGGEIRVQLPLSRTSQGLPGEDMIVLYDGTDQSARNDEHNAWIDMGLQVGEWQQVRVDLTDIARTSFPRRGADSHVNFLGVELLAGDGEVVEFHLDDVAWTSEYHGDEAMDRQRAYLEGLEHPVRSVVGYELSQFPEGHFNIYGDVPLFPYRESYEWSIWDAVDFVEAHGGIFSYNHMFGTAGGLYAPETMPGLVAETVRELVESRVWGADLLEVGYRKRGGALEHHAVVWDALSRSGIWITGVGSSDAHDAADYALLMNNFVTWVGSATCEEEDLRWNLARGAAWFGDPTQFEDGSVEVRLQAEEAMACAGQVVAGQTGLQTIRVAVDPVVAGWSVRLVSNGQTVGLPVVVDEDGAFETRLRVDVTDGATVRAEVRDIDGNAILLTNPIYFVPAELEASIPVERLSF